MHLAGSGRVIIQLTDELSEGVILCDEKGTKVAKIMELIGPVKKPIASATPSGVMLRINCLFSEGLWDKVSCLSK